MDAEGDAVQTASGSLTWLEMSTEDAGRWTWAYKLRWPYHMDLSAVGMWSPELDEYLSDAGVTTARHSPGEERLLTTLAEILEAPSYGAYTIRTVGTASSFVVAMARDADAVVIVDEPGRFRVGRVRDTEIATTIASQLPSVRAASIVRVTLPAQTASLLHQGFARAGTTRETLEKAMDSAGIPADVARRLFAEPGSEVARGMVGAVDYSGGGSEQTGRPSSWTELSDGGMISTQTRSGDVVWEPLTAAAVARAVADALSGLGN